MRLSEYAVVGSYMRFGERVREQLKEARVRIAEACAQPARRRDNHLLWAAPGSGKTYFVEQVAASLPSVRYAELNLAKLDEDAFRSGLAEAVGDGPAVCLVDEVDAKPEEPWPYEALMPFLDVNLDRAGGIVFVLAGSSGSTILEFKEQIRARAKGADVLSRVPEANGWEIAPMEAGDRILVALSQMLNAADELGRSISGVEKLALHYLASAPELTNARQLREFAVRAVQRGSPSDDRVRYDDLFDSGDPRNKAFWVGAMPAAEPLVGSFVLLGVPSSPARPAVAAARAPDLPGATRFLGREQELRDLGGLLAAPDARVVTVTGPGGIGKTRLALQAATEASDAFPDGIFWVALAPLRDPSLLAATFAQSLEVVEQPDRTVMESVLAELSAKRALLVVDNCEHLLDSVAGLARVLAEGCPRLVVVCSSRERLGLSFERVYRVPPMAGTDAEALFVERARAAEPGFLSDEQVPAICAALDELPLAIELAAARVRSLSTIAIRERLTQRLPLLVSRDRDRDERQRTLEATIAWSYDLLDPDEKRLLRSLSVFAGGCTLEAAETVADADLDLLESLLDKSLLRHRSDEADQDRYWLLETIREYAAARLDDAGEDAEVVRARHRDHFCELAVDLGSDWYPPPESVSRYDADRGNFRLVFSEALARKDGAVAVRLLASLVGIWLNAGEAVDSYEPARAALELPGADDRDRGWALNRTAAIADKLGRYQEGERLVEQALENARRRGDTLLACEASGLHGSLCAHQGDYAQANEWLQRAADLARELGSDELEERSLLVQASITMTMATERDPVDTAALERCLAVFHELEPRLTSKGMRAWIDDQVSQVLHHLGRDAEALPLAQTVFPYFGQRAPWVVYFIGFSIGGLGDYKTAVTLVTAAQRHHDEQGIHLDDELRRHIHRFETHARQALQPDTYAAATHAGEALSLEQTLELALNYPNTDSTNPTPRTSQTIPP